MQKNIGVEKATEAARAIGAKLAIPDEPGDFNDLWHETDDDEVRRQLDAAVEVAPVEVVEASNTTVPSDITFGDRFVEQHSDVVRFCEEGPKVWDDKRWNKDSRGKIQELGKVTARSIFDLAKDEDDDDRRAKIAKWAIVAQHKPRIDAGIALASSDSRVRVGMSDFDADPLFLNVANGTIDLRTGQLKPHDRDDLITRLCPVEYDESAKCPRWDTFLDEIFDVSKSLIDFVQRGVGYSLTGLTNEQCLFICHGGGENGKSVLLETLRQIAADYAMSSSIETFMAHGNRGGIPNDIARLAGVRLVTVGETPQRGAFNESLVKDLTGGDTITARFLRREFFEFRPQFKLWIRANHKPQIRGTDRGIWRRMRLIPFTVTIPKKEQDPGLLERLRSELPGILTWAVEGCLDWQQHRLQIPAEVRKATKTYRSEQDVLGSYLKDRIRKNRSSHIMARPLYDDYAAWCDANREGSVLPEKDFSTTMIERGYEKLKTKKGMQYVGINFKG